VEQKGETMKKTLTIRLIRKGAQNLPSGGGFFETPGEIKRQAKLEVTGYFGKVADEKKHGRSKGGVPGEGMTRKKKIG